jgi:hypothetical protein
VTSQSRYALLPTGFFKLPEGEATWSVWRFCTVCGGKTDPSCPKCQGRQGYFVPCEAGNNPGKALRRNLLVPAECGDKTCTPCTMRDTRQIGVVRHAPYCLAFNKRLAREKATRHGFRLTIRCRECLAAERRAR